MIRVKPRWIGLLAPIVFNAMYLAVFLPFALSIEPSAMISFARATGLSVAIGEAAVLVLIGLPLVFVIEKQPRLLHLIKGGNR
jgi:hypothetical protein